MPMEKHEIHLRPADFFERNPSLDVPGNRNVASVEVDCCHKEGMNGNGTQVQDAPTSHLQGVGTVQVNGH